MSEVRAVQLSVRREMDWEWKRIFCSVSTAAKRVSTLRMPNWWKSRATRAPVTGRAGWAADWTT